MCRTICYAQMTTNCHKSWVGGLLNSHTGLGSLQQCQPSTWDDRGWWSVTVCRLHVGVHTDVETKANTNMSYRSNNTGHEIALEEVSFSPFLVKGNKKLPKKHKKTTKKTSGEAPLAMISIQQETERERFFCDSSGLTWMISNTPSSAKGTHILSVYKSYSGIPYMGVFPTNIKEISWGHGITKKRV